VKMPSVILSSEKGVRERRGVQCKGKWISGYHDPARRAPTWRERRNMKMFILQNLDKKKSDDRNASQKKKRHVSEMTIQMEKGISIKLNQKHNSINDGCQRWAKQ
jgi:hypothetical protein